MEHTAKTSNRMEPIVSEITDDVFEIEDEYLSNGTDNDIRHILKDNQCMKYNLINSSSARKLKPFLVKNLSGGSTSHSL